MLGGSYRVSLAKIFTEEAKKLKLNCNIFSYELDKFSPISSIGKIIIGKKWNDKDIINHIEKIIKKYKIDLVTANTDPSTLILSKLKKRNPSCSLTSDYDFNYLCYDKLQLKKFLYKYKIKTTYFEKKFPLIAKNRFGSSSKDIKILNNKREYNKFIKNNKNKKNYIIEKYIKGKEFSVDSYVTKKKENLGIVIRERVKVLKGESIIMQTIKDKKLNKLAIKIIKILNLTGPINLQFIFNKEYYLMEINPRFPGGTLATIKSGLNIPSIMIREIKKLKINKMIKLKKIKMVKYFTEYYENNY